MRHLFIAIIVFLVAVHCFCSEDSTFFENIQALTFRQGQFTTARRTAPMKQLTCTGEACPYTEYLPQVVQCKNVGKDDHGIVQWRCDADLSDRVRFGKTDVNCEGFRFASDKQVLKGSCALEYELLFTTKGRAHLNKAKSQDHDSRQHQRRSRQEYYTPEPVTTTSSDGAGLFFGFIVLIVVVIMACICCSNSRATPNVVPSSSSYTISSNPPRTYSETTNIYPSAPTYNPEYTTTTTTYTNTAPYSSSSAWSNTAAAATGFGTGFLVGRATAPSNTYAQTEHHHYYHDDTNTTSNIYPNAPQRHNDADDDDDHSTSRTATGFGTSKIR